MVQSVRVAVVVAWATHPPFLSSLGGVPELCQLGHSATGSLSVLHFGTRKEVIRVSSLYL